MRLDVIENPCFISSLAQLLLACAFSYGVGSISLSASGVELLEALITESVLWFCFYVLVTNWQQDF
jgi:hypothetical protein